MEGVEPHGPVVIFDDDGYYMGGVLAERLRALGREVVLVTPADNPSPWTVNTLEYGPIQRRLRELEVHLLTNHSVAALEGGAAVVEDIWTGRRREIACASLVTVTARLPEDALFQALETRRSEWAGAGVLSIDVIGDAQAPGAIVHAVYAGHRYARELGEPRADVPFRRRVATIGQA
jgi:dimethylamine/trimethylamine dehydrogenase